MIDNDIFFPFSFFIIFDILIILFTVDVTT